MAVSQQLLCPIVSFFLSTSFSCYIIHRTYLYWGGFIRINDPKIRRKQHPVCLFRILENNNIHQISTMTFSGLNSLVLLWVSALTLYIWSFTFISCFLDYLKWLLFRVVPPLLRVKVSEHEEEMCNTVFFLSLIDRVLLNNSLTKLDDICQEMPRLNWL